MEDNFKDFFSESTEVVSDYLETRWKLIRLTAAGKIAHALAVFMVIVISAMLVFFVVIFVGLLLAFWISDATGSFTLGFSLTAVLFLLLLIIGLAFRKKLILIPISNLLLRELAQEIEQEDKHD